MEQQTQQPRVHIVETTTTAPIDDGTMAMKATTREHVAPGRSVSAPHHSGGGGADAALAPSAAPPSFSSRSLRNETSPSGARAASSTALLSATHKRVSPAPNQLAASLPTYSAAAGQRSADLESSGVVPEERVAKLRAKWGIPSTDALVRVFPCVYKKPRPSHGKMYIFPNHLVFVSHSHRTNICIPFAEVEHMVRKRHRIHLVTHDKTHRLRGSLTQNSTTYGILLAVWQRAKGDSTIDLETIRACDKKLQKAMRKGERRGSLTDTSDGTLSEMGSDDDYGGHPEDTESEDEPILECHTASAGSSAGVVEQQSQPQEPRLEIPLEPQAVAPPSFAALLQPPADAQNVNRVAPQTLSASLERCWSLIYDSNSSNVQRSMAKNLLYDISLGPWVPDSEPGLMTRVVKYTKPMQSAFVKGDALVEQTQKVVLLSQPSKKLCVWQESRMQGVPYADSFVIHAVYEASENGAGKTNISNTAWVVWIKSPPRLLRGKIERGSVTGVEESFKSLMADTEAALVAEALAPAPAASPAAAASSTPPAAAVAPTPAATASSVPVVPAPASVPMPAGTPVMAPMVGQVMGIAPGVQVMPGGGVPTMQRAGGLQIDEKCVYAVVLVLILSVIANVILAACR